MRSAARIQRQCQRTSNPSESLEAGFVKGWLLSSRGVILFLRVGPTGDFLRDGATGKSCVSLHTKTTLVYRTHTRHLAFTLLLITGISLASGLVGYAPPATVRPSCPGSRVAELWQ
jgi:hypothetical protein